MSEQEPGRYLSKDEYEAIINNHDFVERKPCEITMVTHPESALTVWNTIFQQLVSTGQPMRQSLLENLDSWIDNTDRVLAILNTIDDKDLKAVGLLLWVDGVYSLEVMLTLTPIMDQPYADMLVKTLKDVIVRENNGKLVIPERYRSYEESSEK